MALRLWAGDLSNIKPWTKEAGVSVSVETPCVHGLDFLFFFPRNPGPTPCSPRPTT